MTIYISNRSVWESVSGDRSRVTPIQEMALPRLGIVGPHLPGGNWRYRRGYRGTRYWDLHVVQLPVISVGPEFSEKRLLGFIWQVGRYVSYGTYDPTGILTGAFSSGLMFIGVEVKTLQSKMKVTKSSGQRLIETSEHAHWNETIPIITYHLYLSFKSGFISK